MDTADRFEFRRDEAARVRARWDADAAPLTRLPDGAPAPIGTLTPGALLLLQRAVGNGRVARLLAEEQAGPPRPIQGGGEPLEPATGAAMEGSFGTDFGLVRAHRGPEAARLAAEPRARANPVGEDLMLGETAPEPRTIAHEITQVVHQRAGLVEVSSIGSGVQVADPSGRFEHAAEATADRVKGVEGALRVAGVSQGVQRHVEEPNAEEGAVEALPLQRQTRQTAREDVAVIVGRPSHTTEENESPKKKAQMVAWRATAAALAPPGRVFEGLTVDTAFARVRYVKAPIGRLFIIGHGDPAGIEEIDATGASRSTTMESLTKRMKAAIGDLKERRPQSVEILSLLGRRVAKRLGSDREGDRGSPCPRSTAVDSHRL